MWSVVWVMMFTARLLVYWECFAHEKTKQTGWKWQRDEESSNQSCWHEANSSVPTCSPLASKVRIVSVGDTHAILRHVLVFAIFRKDPSMCQAKKIARQSNWQLPAMLKKRQARDTTQAVKSDSLGCVLPLTETDTTHQPLSPTKTTTTRI